MNALILKGKYKGTVCEVSQWCNDWFMLNSSNPDIASKPFSPSSLAFTLEGFKEIRNHKNNGFLFDEFEPIASQPICGIYTMTFKKIR